MVGQKVQMLDNNLAARREIRLVELMAISRDMSSVGLTGIYSVDLLVLILAV